MLRIVALIVFLAVPVTEILVFIAVASAIGVLPTLGLALATSVLGIVLVRRQGLSALRQLRTNADARRLPGTAIGQTIVVAIGGLLLILPGFITDVIGLLLFVPAVRGGMWRAIAGSVKVHRPEGTSRPFGTQRPRGQVIDLEATEVRPARDRDGGPPRQP